MLPALISSAAALLICLINNFAVQSQNKELHNQTIQLIQYRIDELSKAVEKHNNIVERMALIERDMKTAFRSIDEIKEKL